jgi:hypothetical protein
MIMMCTYILSANAIANAQYPMPFRRLAMDIMAHGLSLLM